MFNDEKLIKEMLSHWRKGTKLKDLLLEYYYLGENEICLLFKKALTEYFNKN